MSERQRVELDGLRSQVAELWAAVHSGAMREPVPVAIRQLRALRAALRGIRRTQEAHELAEPLGWKPEGPIAAQVGKTRPAEPRSLRRVLRGGPV